MIKINGKWKHTKIELDKMKVKGKEPRLQYWKNISEEGKLRRNAKVSISNSNKPKSNLHRIAISKAYDSKIIKDKVRHLGPKNGMYGKHRTLEEKENQKRKMTILWNQDSYKKIKREQRMEQLFPNKNTSIEIKIRNFLETLHIPFKMHKSVMGITQPDFFIEPNICIYCDGDYWHCNPSCYPIPINEMQTIQVNRDKKINEMLRFAGFKVIRLWEKEINNLELNKFQIMMRDIK